MPNWCDTTYKIVGPLKSRKAFVAMLDHLNSLPEPLVPNGFGKLWLGCIVSYLGGSCEEIYCRGQILGYRRIRNQLILNVESAWGEPLETREFLQSKFLDLQFFYQSEEPGMCVFETNDKERKYFQERYILDFSDESREGCYLWVYFGTLRSAAQFVSFHCVEGRKVKPTMEGIREALDTYQNEKPDDVSYLFEEFKVIED